jgi:hypothetical protein
VAKAAPAHAGAARRRSQRYGLLELRAPVVKRPLSTTPPHLRLTRRLVHQPPATGGAAQCQKERRSPTASAVVSSPRAARRVRSDLELRPALRRLAARLRT